MKIGKIITLVKAGYTPNEIASLERQDEVLQLLEEGIKKEDVPTLLELAKDDEREEPETPPVPETPEAKDTPKEPETDYKSKYETLLKQTQLANTRKNIAGDLPNNEEIITELVKSFM